MSTSPTYDIRTNLIDVAESLFAERGYFGTSIRDITSAAGERLAAVNYHFESKEGLFRAVIDRRAPIISHDRKALILAIDHNGPADALFVRQMVEAILSPLMHRAATGDQGWNNYARLIAAVAGTRLWSEEIMSKYFNEPVRLFVEKMMKAFPHCDEYTVLNMYQFTVGEMAYLCAQNGRMESISSGRYSSTDLKKLYDKAVRFITGGILSLAEDRD